MQFTSSIILAFAATLAFAAPTPNVGDISSFLSFDQSGRQSFNLQSFNQNDIANLLVNFDVGGFNNQFSGQFDNQAIQLLLLALGGNQFGNSNLNSFGDLSQFQVSSFASQFNGQNGANWQVNQVLGLLLQLGLVDQQSFNNQFFFNQQIQFASQSCFQSASFGKN